MTVSAASVIPGVRAALTGHTAKVYIFEMRLGRTMSLTIRTMMGTTMASTTSPLITKGPIDASSGIRDPCKAIQSLPYKSSGQDLNRPVP
jgi:hypothetical protein